MRLSTGSIGEKCLGFVVATSSLRAQCKARTGSSVTSAD